eukprot:2399659-Amphidinium_carterae.1
MASVVQRLVAPQCTVLHQTQRPDGINPEPLGMRFQFHWPSLFFRKEKTSESENIGMNIKIP